MVTCKEEQACDYLKRGLPAELHFIEPDNWTQKYNLVCDRAYIRKHSRTIVLVINTIFSLFLLSCSDTYGRRRLFQLASLLVACGMVAAVVLPVFYLKMVGLAMATGAEATFSGLFTIYINENTTPDSKLRSYLVTIGFFGYALGCSIFNAIAYYSMKSDFIILVTAISLIACVIPSFLFYFETPYYLFKKGRVTELFCTLMGIHRTNSGSKASDPSQQQSVEDFLISAFGFGDSEKSKEFFRDTEIRLVKLEKEKVVGKVPLLIIMRSRPLFFHLLALTMMGGLLYTTFYGMSINIDKLGYDDLRLNGILLGAMQALGYLLVVPFTYRMKRRRWSIIFQAMILACNLYLMLLPRDSNSSDVKFQQTAVSTLLMPTVISAVFPLFYIYITEVFPSEVRGTANATILFLARLVGSFAPFFESLSEHFNVHILVGCSLLVFVSLPLSLGMKETLIIKKA